MTEELDIAAEQTRWKAQIGEMLPLSLAGLFVAGVVVGGAVAYLAVHRAIPGAVERGYGLGFARGVTRGQDAARAERVGLWTYAGRERSADRNVN